MAADWPTLYGAGTARNVYGVAAVTTCWRAEVAKTACTGVRAPTCCTAARAMTCSREVPATTAYVVDLADVGSGAPDRILDFQPEEGDRIQLRGFGPLDLRDPLKLEQGVVSIRLRGGRQVPVVDIGREDLKLRVETDRRTITILGAF